MPASHEQLLEQIIERATTDQSFRRWLIESPEAAIFSTFGIRVPEDYRISFMEKPGNLDALIILPDLRPHGEELCDEDLDAAAGGNADPW